MYISGYSRRGRVFARRWDLKNPAIVEEQQLGLLPESYARSELYSHTSILFAQHYIRAVLITTNSWVNNNPYRYRQSENGLLLSQGSGWKGHWKTLETSNFTFNRQLSDYELLGPLPFKCRHIAEESDWLTNGRSRRLKSETLWNQSSYFLDSEEKLTRKQCHALEAHTTFMLLGEGPWVEPRIETFLHWPSGIFDEYRLFRWTMDYYRNTAVVHRRGLMDGVLGKDYYFREKKVRQGPSFSLKVLHVCKEQRPFMNRHKTIRWMLAASFPFTLFDIKKQTSQSTCKLHRSPLLPQQRPPGQCYLSSD